MATTALEESAIKSFALKPGTLISDKYEIVSLLGSGWEGEVYLIREKTTGIERAAKFYFPQRNKKDKSVRFYARKLHKLRHCPIVLQYHTQDSCIFDFQKINFVVSEFVEGEMLSEFLKHQPGKRLQPFMALHMLHELCVGIECIHRNREYHGDLHTDNIIVRRRGIGFEVKLLDMYHWGGASSANINFDVVCLIRIFYDILGGKKYYKNQPDEIKAIVCGLKQSLILKKFRTARQLRIFIENIDWD